MVNIKILNKIKMKFLNLRSDSIGCWVRRPNTTRETQHHKSIRSWVPSLRQTAMGRQARDCKQVCIPPILFSETQHHNRFFLNKVLTFCEKCIILII